jgi:hypothetical protein
MVSFWYMAQRGFAGYSKPTQYAIVWGSVLAILISIFLFLKASGVISTYSDDDITYKEDLTPQQREIIPQELYDQLPSRGQ